MAPASVASSAGHSRKGTNLSDSARYQSWPQEYSTFTASKLARDGASCSSSFHLNVEPYQQNSKLELPETPTAKNSPGFVQLRPSAEKYNPNAKFRPQRSPAVPAADLNTSKLAEAFPGFSGIAEDAKPLSPNPFVTKAHGHKLKMPSWAQQRQPRVRDENDASIVTETHSSPAKAGNKNTRSGGINVPKTRKGPQPHLYKPAPGLVQNTAASTSAGESKPMAITAQGSLTSMPNGSTQQTLNLPHGTNLTELFSGVIRQPPPNTAQQTIRPRASRFASATKPQTAAEPKVQEIPVPVDERYLLESIDVLQDRVAELEAIKGQLEVTNTKLDQKNFELEIEKRELTARRRSDSAVSVADDASNDSKGQTAAHRRLATEKNRLESTCWALQGQKDLLLRDVDVAETAVKDITQERDHYKAELSTAEVHIQYLQTEKATIEQQRAQAVAQLATANSNVETLLQDKLTLFEENDKLKAQVALLTQGSAAKEDSSLQHDTFDDADGDTDEGPLDMDTISMMNQQQKQKEQVKKQVEAPKNPAEYDNHHSESSHNITYLSYSGDSSLCKVRKTLEQERKARQQRHQADAAGKADVSCVHDEEHVGAKASEEQTRECSESSVIKRPKRAATPRDELTSGFIIPDITFNQQRMTEAQASLELPANTQPQSGIVQQDTFHGHTERSDILSYSPVLPVEQQPVQQAAEPRQLPPVSDEELDITIHDEEPTIRPTQPPDVALATVLDSLHAELAAQRAEVAKYQASYDRHDVSISRRQRKQIIGKIQALLQSCEVKADQIYNLHDVIEGHKQRGQPISQYQIDNTLQSLGLDLPWEGLDSRRRSIASSRSI